MLINEPLEEYKRLYSEYISHAVNLHNYHHAFISLVGYEPGLKARQSLRRMIGIEQQLVRLSRRAYEVKIKNLRLEKKMAKEAEEAAKKARQLQRQKKNVDLPK